MLPVVLQGRENKNVDVSLFLHANVVLFMGVGYKRTWKTDGKERETF